MDYDFCGWATKNDLPCSDGRVIKRDAFKVNDKVTVPLVWNHQHNSPGNILGHAMLENRPEGVYAYCYLNKTQSGKDAKEMVEHGDIKSLSILANNLQEQGPNVIHGVIREVSMVLAGANPGATIETVLAHGDLNDECLAIDYYEDIELKHNNDPAPEDPKPEETPKPEDPKLEETPKPEDPKLEETPKPEDPNIEHSGIKTGGTTDISLGDMKKVVDGLSDEEQKAVYAMVGMALASTNNENGGDKNMVKHNLFEGKDQNEVVSGGTLTHDQFATMVATGKQQGSLKAGYLAHAEEYGINNIEYLFPDAVNLDSQPQFISRNMDWVAKVMNGMHHTPFSRIKSMFADITEDEARAKGYIKGKLKKEEVFTLLKRTTSPTTVYKKQKLDRDDIVDITDIDVVMWLKAEMRMMLDEEIARAVLIGDGRLSSSDDKIKEDCIRPIWKDDDLYSVKVLQEIDTADTDTAREANAKAFIKLAIRNRKLYKGSGNPSLFTTEDVITDCLLIEDGVGRRIYQTVNDLATALRVSEIVAVEPMTGNTRVVDSKTHTLTGIMVNLIDYNAGADKGGAVNMFDDFDIDFNQQKYLIETRCSGALVKPFSALIFETVPKAAG